MRAVFTVILERGYSDEAPDKAHFPSMEGDLGHSRYGLKKKASHASNSIS